MKRFYASRTFWGLFTSFLLIAILITVGMFAYSWQNGANENLSKTYAANMQAVSAATDYLNGIFTDNLILASRMRNTPWVQKYLVDSSVFSEEFDDVVRQGEISKDFLFYSGEHDAISRRAVVFPYRETCISYSLWAHYSDYFGILGVPVGERRVLMEDIKKVAVPTLIRDAGSAYIDRDLLICFPIENIPRPRAYWCVFLNTGTLLEYISNMLPSTIVGFKLADGDGNELVRSGAGESGGNLTVISREVYNIGWTCEYYIDNTVATFEYTSAYRNLFLYCLLLIAGGFVLSAFLAMLTYRPVGKLLVKVSAGGATGRVRGRASDYARISDSIDEMMKKYNASRRNNVLQRMLTGLFEFDAETLRSLDIPFTNEGFYQVFCCTCLTGISPELDDKESKYAEATRFLKERAEVRFEMLESFSDEIILIVMYGGEEEAKMLSPQILTRLQASDYAIFTGCIKQGMIGISISYQFAKDKYLHLAGCTSVKYYFPLDWESQLIIALRSGNAAVAAGICAELQRENERRLTFGIITSADYYKLFTMLINTIKRVQNEISLDEAHVFASFPNLFVKSSKEEIWEEIAKICDAICEKTGETGGGPPGIEQKIIDYIDKHFSEHGLSLTMLEDIFGLSTNTINKCIKKTRNVTFLSYLTQKRMEHTKELLASGRYKVSQIAEAVGYDNEYTFRRAFLRYAGVRVQDYVP